MERTRVRMRRPAIPLSGRPVASIAGAFLNPGGWIVRLLIRTCILNDLRFVIPVTDFQLLARLLLLLFIIGPVNRRVRSWAGAHRTIRHLKPAYSEENVIFSC